MRKQRMVRKFNRYGVGLNPTITKVKIQEDENRKKDPCIELYGDMRAVTKAMPEILDFMRKTQGATALRC